ncbi:MAG TPA: Cyclin D1-binding domain-containing protein [Verrucomicrobiae bacterium]|jgi:hypothetical protein|nr:Cyclin D1-binding domain-containing protein [Verrucomicrobiae bacterium]
MILGNRLNGKSGVWRFEQSRAIPLITSMVSEVLEQTLATEAIDLSGEWLGFYIGHFDEVVRITQMGDYVEAVKITGDEYVPAEEVTWRANLRTGRGEGQIAEREFRNPRFVPGRLRIAGPDKVVFTWENCGEVEFRKDE